MMAVVVPGMGMPALDSLTLGNLTMGSVVRMVTVCLITVCLITVCIATVLIATVRTVLWPIAFVSREVCAGRLGPFRRVRSRRTFGRLRHANLTG